MHEGRVTNIVATDKCHDYRVILEVSVFYDRYKEAQNLLGVGIINAEYGVNNVNLSELSGYQDTLLDYGIERKGVLGTDMIAQFRARKSKFELSSIPVCLLCDLIKQITTGKVGPRRASEDLRQEFLAE